MNQEIDGKLKEIFERPAAYEFEEFKKAVSELVCSTVPKERNSPSNVHPHAEAYHNGWNDCRKEILKKWDVGLCRCHPNHSRCKYCLTFPETPKPEKKCPVCLTVQSGAHTCKRAKTTAVEPSDTYIANGIDKPVRFVSEFKERLKPMQEVEPSVDAIMGKYKHIPAVHEKEPSVEEIAEGIVKEIQKDYCFWQTSAKQFCGINHNTECRIKSLIAEALRNERNRHG